MYKLGQKTVRNCLSLILLVILFVILYISLPFVSDTNEVLNVDYSERYYELLGKEFLTHSEREEFIKEREDGNLLIKQKIKELGYEVYE